MNKVAALLRAKNPPALPLVLAILAGATSVKGGHGLLAVGGALSAYPMYLLTIAARVAISRLRAT